MKKVFILIAFIFISMNLYAQYRGDGLGNYKGVYARTDTKVIGFDKSCDYICDGIADDVEINSAITALTNGGNVMLREGHYKISAPILVNITSVTICGTGEGTVLAQDSSNDTSCILISKSGTSIRNIKFVPIHTTNSQILITTTTIASDNISIENCVFVSSFNISVISSTNSASISETINDLKIHDCRFYMAGYNGTAIYIAGNGNNHEISNCEFKNFDVVLAYPLTNLSAINYMSQNTTTVAQKNSYIRIVNNTIYGFNKSRFYNLYDVVLANNIIDGLFPSGPLDNQGFMVQGGDPNYLNNFNNAIISGNVFKNLNEGVSTDCPSAWAQDNLVITGNVFAGCNYPTALSEANGAIRQAFRWYIMNNTSYGTGTTHYFPFDSSAQGFRFRNNIGIGGLWEDGDTLANIDYSNVVSTRTKDLNLFNNRILNLSSPTVNSHASTKYYVDEATATIDDLYDTKLNEVSTTDLEISTFTQGVVFNSTTKKWRLTVDDTGILKTENVTPSISLVSPNGGESLAAGAQTITWTSSGSLNRVSVYLSTDSGGTYNTTLAENISNAGLLAVNFSTAAATCRILIKDPYHVFYGSSTLDFEIFEIPDGMLSWWKVNEAAGTTLNDIASKNADGTMVDTTWTTDGGKSCITLDGDGDYVTLGDNKYSSADLSSGTFCAWIKPTTPDNDRATMFSLEYKIYASYPSWGATALRLLETSAGFSQDEYLAATAGNVTRDASWHFVIFSWGAGSYNYYLDNSASLATLAFQGSGPDMDGGSGTNYIGITNGAGDSFKGLIGQMRLYNKVLSSDERTALYNSGR